MKKNNIIKLIGMSLLTIAIIALCFTYPTQYSVNYKTGIQQISNGKFYDATMSLAQASLDNYKNGKVLYDYATGQDDYSTGSQPSDVLDVMKDIPVNYNGELAEDIKTFTKKMEVAKADGDKGIETEETKKNAALIEALKKGVAEANSKPYNPEVGMSSSDVKSSLWGNPEKVNRTTTAYGVSEQWVYGSGRYVYLENGIVTATQD